MLRFNLGPIPVAIHLSFLLLIYIAYTYTQDLAEAGVMGIGLLAGVLVHELGHALTARRFGAKDVRITIFALGGVTSYPPPKGFTAGRRFLVAASGSALGIVTGLVVLLATRNDLISGDVPELIATGFVFAALVWGVLNWVPIRPLDGGQMLTSALQIVSPRRGAAIAKVISAICAAAIVIWLAQNGETGFALYVAFIAFIGLRADSGSAPAPDAPQQPSETEPEPPASFPL